MPEQPELPGTLTACLRCGVPCRTGTPDSEARAIRESNTVGFCSNCVVTNFLLSVESIAELINGHPRRGSHAGGLIVPGRAGLGPEIFLNRAWRERAFGPQMQAICRYTQLDAKRINWIEVVGNWGLPWPKGHKPQFREF